MTTPHRQDDGLLALASDIMCDLYCARNDFDNVTSYRIDLIYDKSERLVEALRATPASRDGAEGAGVSDERAIELAHQICTGKLSAVQGAVEIMQYATDGVRQLERDGYFTPPKPAPDALSPTSGASTVDK